MLRPIHHTLGPHVDWTYLKRALAISYAPHRYVRGSSVHALESLLSQLLRGDAITFASGREALVALLKAIGLTSGEEVIIQGYTCIAVPNAIHAAGGVPVYADIDPDTLNLIVETVRPLITTRTRAIICQHTFGIPAPTEELRKLCNAHRLLLIEDCAHVLPDESGPKEIGRFGDYLMLSFGREKAISGIVGGAIVSRTREVTNALKNLRERAADHSWWYVARLLNYPARMWWIRPFFGTAFIKVYLWLIKKLKLMIMVYEPEEKRGHMSPLLHRLPNACAYLVLGELKRLKVLNDHRRALTRFFLEESKKRGWTTLAGIRADLPLQKFPLFTKNAERMRQSLKRRNIHLGDGWTGCVVCPPDIEPLDANYAWGSDPKAEAACQQILSLPTHPTMTKEQARQLMGKLNALMQNSKLEIRNPKEQHMIVSPATDQQRWDSFLLSQPWTPFLQSWAMGEVYEAIGQQAIRMQAEESGRILGICFGHIVSARRGKHLSIPYGPVIDANLSLERARAVAVELLAESAKRAQAERLGFVRFSPFWPTRFALGNHVGPYRILPSPLHLLAEHIWYLNLQSATEESLLSGMRKTTRNLIRRAERDGVTVRASTDPNRDIDVFLKLHEETKRRHGFTPYTDVFFRAQVKHFTPLPAAEGHDPQPRQNTPLPAAAIPESRLRSVTGPSCTLYLADYQGQTIAASIHVHFGSETSYHHGASASAFSKIPASSLLQWAAIKDALARGDRVYNFWGISPLRGEDTRPASRTGRHEIRDTSNGNSLASRVLSLKSHPFAGVTLFKTGFGGQLLELPHCMDIPLSGRYHVTRAIEQIRKWRRGF